MMKKNSEHQEPFFYQNITHFNNNFNKMFNNEKN